VRAFGTVRPAVDAERLRASDLPSTFAEADRACRLRVGCPQHEHVKPSIRTASVVGEAGDQGRPGAKYFEHLKMYAELLEIDVRLAGLSGAEGTIRHCSTFPSMPMSAKSPCGDPITAQ
jgi:hypothetical protein